MPEIILAHYGYVLIAWILCGVAALCIGKHLTVGKLGWDTGIPIIMFGPVILFLLILCWDAEHKGLPWRGFGE